MSTAEWIDIGNSVLSRRMPSEVADINEGPDMLRLPKRVSYDDTSSTITIIITIRSTAARALMELPTNLSVVLVVWGLSVLG